MKRLFIGLMLAAMAAIGFGGLSASAAPATNWQLAGGSVKTASDGSNTFNFSVPDKTMLLYNSKDSTLIGDQHLSTMTASFMIQGVTGDFTYGGEGTASNPCGTPGTVRLAFESIAPGTKFAYTNYWWSNPISVQLANGPGAMSVAVTNPSLWSDWNGTNGAAVPEAFTAAASNMTLVGLSFGGGCFFENGVGTTDGSGSFTLTTFAGQL